MNRRLAITAALIALSAALSACNTGGATGVREEPTPTVKASQGATKAGGTIMSDSATTMTVGLDQKAVWNNGVTMRLSKFSRGTSSAYAAPSGKAYLSFTVTYTNGSKTPLDASMVTLSCPNGGEEIFDGDSGFNGAPSGHVLPGRSLSWVTACTFKASDTRAQIEATPFDTSASGWYRTAIFTGKIA